MSRLKAILVLKCAVKRFDRGRCGVYGKYSVILVPIEQSRETDAVI